MNCKEFTSYEFAKTYCIKNLKDIEIDKIVFIRGYFELRGNINDKNILCKGLECSLEYDENILKLINEFGFKYSFNTSKNILFEDYNALDFLSKLYDNSDARYRNKDMYIKYIKWVTFGADNKIPSCKFLKYDSDAITPRRVKASDSGYDITIIKKIKNLSPKTSLYDTGIIVSPDFGYNSKIISMDSLIKSGYILINSFENLENSKKKILIYLTKVDDSLPDLILPLTCCKLILERCLHYTMVECTNMDDL